MKPCAANQFAERIPRWAWALTVTALLLATSAASAQPVIKTPPRNLAVVLGEEATFSVLASDTTPLGYAWEHDGTALEGATNSSLRLSNVALSDLGSYTVLVRSDAGLTMSQAAWLKLARWTEFVYFGDSECQASYGNGPTWGDYLPDLLSLPTSAKRIYFTGNASEADVRSQTLSYLAKYRPTTNTLVAVWKGGFAGDIMALRYTPARSVSNRMVNLTRLADAGVIHFLIPTLPSPRLWPQVSSLAPSQTFSNYDQLLDRALTDLAQSRPVTIYRPDMETLEEAIQVDPAAYGFTNLTGLAQSCSRCDRSKYYIWDGFHPTTAANKVWSHFMYRALVPPLVVSASSKATGNELALQWQGGSPPFRLERCQDLSNGQWETAELTFSTAAKVAASVPHEFFRILQLGQ